MPISVQHPVDVTKYEITGDVFQDWGYWTKDHPHFGVDYGCPKGTPFYSATVRGYVYAIHNAPKGQWMSDFGLCIVVKVTNPDTGEVWYYLYAHLSRADVILGQTIEPGQLLGLTGDSGAADGAHLHIQVSSSPQFARNREETGDPILFSRTSITTPLTPPVIVPHVPTGEEAWREVIALNEAIMLRGAINRVAYDPDYGKVKQAAEALRKAGFVL